MRITLAFLILILFNFKSNAYTVEKMYKNCKLSEKWKYGTESERNRFSDGEFYKTLMCDISLGTLMKSGVDNCNKYNEILKSEKKNMPPAVLQQIFNVFNQTKNVTANDKISLDQVRASFLNFAQKRPDLWEYDIWSLRHFFLSKPFPCILQKP